jgi:hypothetical protein
MVEACSAYRIEERLYRVLVRKPEGKRPLGRCRRRQKDNTVRSESGGALIKCAGSQQKEPK